MRSCYVKYNHLTILCPYSGKAIIWACCQQCALALFERKRERWKNVLEWECVRLCVCQFGDQIQYLPDGVQAEWTFVEIQLQLQDGPVLSINMDTFQEIFASALGSGLQSTGWTKGKFHSLILIPLLDIINSYVQRALGARCDEAFVAMCSSSVDRTEHSVQWKSP